MNKRELLKKVKANEGLTVEEIIEYQKIVKPVKHVYGKYGNLALEYLKEHNVGKYWALAGSLPEYLHNVDKQADRLYMTMYNKLSKSDIDALDWSVNTYGALSYDEIKEKSHDIAWRSMAKDFAISWESIAREAGLDSQDIEYITQTLESNKSFA